MSVATRYVKHVHTCVVKGISNLIVDLMMSLIVISFFTVTLSVTVQLENKAIRGASNVNGMSNFGKCALGWLIYKDNSHKGVLVIGNPHNYSIVASVLINGVKIREVHLASNDVVIMNVNVSALSNILIVGPNGCISRVQEVYLP